MTADAAGDETAEPASLRAAMVERLGGSIGPIGEAVADALGWVPRHLFVPEVPIEEAYRDEAIVTKRDADGLPSSSSSQPAIMAVMLDQLGLAPGHRVLEIGAGTGYNAALMWHIVGPQGQVVSVDIDADVVDRARRNLALAGFPDVTVVCADGAAGFGELGPYDRIIATVGVWDLAPAWLDQLAPGGRLVVPLDLRGVQRSIAFERADGHWASRSVVACGFMRMRGDLAGPERTHVLDGGLSIMVPDGGEVDAPAMLAALAETPTRVPTQVRAGPEHIFRGLGLWLAVADPRWCVVSGPGPTLAAPPLRVQDLGITGGVKDADGIALFTLDGDVAVLGYGSGGPRLAAELAAHVRAWDDAGRPGDDGLRVDAYPASSVDAGAIRAGVVIDKRHTRIALSWSV